LNITRKIKTTSNLGGRSRKETRERRIERDTRTQKRKREREKRERLKPEGTERNHRIQT
jgi:hypothetical protein